MLRLEENLMPEQKIILNEPKKIIYLEY
jgi:hypothetical protein